LYYCGRILGRNEIPQSDGICGMGNGPQCNDCKGYTRSSPPETRSSKCEEEVISNLDWDISFSTMLPPMNLSTKGSCSIAETIKILSVLCRITNSLFKEQGKYGIERLISQDILIPLMKLSFQANSSTVRMKATQTLSMMMAYSNPMVVDSHFFRSGLDFEGSNAKSFFEYILFQYGLHINPYCQSNRTSSIQMLPIIKASQFRTIIDSICDSNDENWLQIIQSTFSDVIDDSPSTLSSLKELVTADLKSYNSILIDEDEHENILFKTSMKNFYEIYNPESINSIDSIFDEYKHNKILFLNKLQDKYDLDDEEITNIFNEQEKPQIADIIDREVIDVVKDVDTVVTSENVNRLLGILGIFGDYFGGLLPGSRVQYNNKSNLAENYIILSYSSDGIFGDSFDITPTTIPDLDIKVQNVSKHVLHYDNAVKTTNNNILSFFKSKKVQTLKKLLMSIVLTDTLFDEDFMKSGEDIIESVSTSSIPSLVVLRFIKSLGLDATSTLVTISNKLNSNIEIDLTNEISYIWPRLLREIIMPRIAVSRSLFFDFSNSLENNVLNLTQISRNNQSQRRVLVPKNEYKIDNLRFSLFKLEEKITAFRLESFEKCDDENDEDSDEENEVEIKKSTKSIFKSLFGLSKSKELKEENERESCNLSSSILSSIFSSTKKSLFPENNETKNTISNVDNLKISTGHNLLPDELLMRQLQNLICKKSYDLLSLLFQNLSCVNRHISSSNYAELFLLLQVAGYGEENFIKTSSKSNLLQTGFSITTSISSPDEEVIEYLPLLSSIISICNRIFTQFFINWEKKRLEEFEELEKIGEENSIKDGAGALDEPAAELENELWKCVYIHGVNIRSGIQLSSNVTKVINQDEIIECHPGITMIDDYTRIRMWDDSGWTSTSKGDLIFFTAISNQKSILKFKIECPNVLLRIRPEPNTNRTEVGVYHDGDIIYVFAEEINGWYKLVNGVGYLMKGASSIHYKLIEEVIKNKEPKILKNSSSSSKSSNRGYTSPQEWSRDISNGSLTYSNDNTSAKRSGSVSTYPACFAKLPSDKSIITVTVDAVVESGCNTLSFGICTPGFPKSSSDGFGKTKNSWGICDDRGKRDGKAKLASDKTIIKDIDKFKLGDKLQAIINTTEGWCDLKINDYAFEHRFDIPSGSADDYLFGMTFANDHKCTIIHEVFIPENSEPVDYSTPALSVALAILNKLCDDSCSRLFIEGQGEALLRELVKCTTLEVITSISSGEMRAIQEIVSKVLFFASQKKQSNVSISILSSSSSSSSSVLFPPSIIDLLFTICNNTIRFGELVSGKKTGAPKSSPFFQSILQASIISKSFIISIKDGSMELNESLEDGIQRRLHVLNVINVRSSSSTVSPIIIESAHNYQNNQSIYKEISVKDCLSYTITFDDKSSTERKYDYITFYKDSSYTSFWGDEKYHGGHNDSGEKHFPGVNGLADLVIPADKFYFHFKSDNSNNYWGYKITVTPNMVPNNLDSFYRILLSLEDPTISRIESIIDNKLIECIEMTIKDGIENTNMNFDKFSNMNWVQISSESDFVKHSDRLQLLNNEAIEFMTSCFQQSNLTSIIENSTNIYSSNNYLKFRFEIIKKFNIDFVKILSMINLSDNNSKWSISSKISSCRKYILKISKMKNIISTIKDTECSGNSFELILSRTLSIKNAKQGKCDDEGRWSIFGQAFRVIHGMPPSQIRRKDQLWKVAFAGEHSNDVGGPYRESWTVICQELQTGTLPLLIPCPNALSDTGQNRDTWLLNSNSTRKDQIEMFKFLGKLMGCAIRSQNFMDINLSPFVWKMIAGENLSMDDLAQINIGAINLIKSINSVSDEGKFNSEYGWMNFTITNSQGFEVKLIPNGDEILLNWENRSLYCSELEKYYKNDMVVVSLAVKAGLATQIPSDLICLLKWDELERMVCGNPHIDVNLLKEATEYSSYSSNSQLIQWFWEIMNEYEEVERKAYLKFIWGRSRLPLSLGGFKTKMKITKYSISKSKNADKYLPIAHTCFFSIDIPNYSSKEILRDKLSYAIFNCEAIDGDDDSTGNRSAALAFEDDF
jgi:hypothetical protein